MSNVMICDNEFHFSKRTQRQIDLTTSLKSHQWIYHVSSAHDEEILLEADEWLLAKDKHPGTDTRFLIIYKDRGLRTIRDLRRHHVIMLNSSIRSTRRYLMRNHNEVSEDGSTFTWCFFFHYYPSVFQLHAHVMANPLHRNGDRLHGFNHVIRNLMTDTHWYRDALILTKTSRFLSLLTQNISPYHVHVWGAMVRNLLRIKLKSKMPDSVKINTHLSRRR